MARLSSASHRTMRSLLSSLACADLLASPGCAALRPGHEEAFPRRGSRPSLAGMLSPRRQRAQGKPGADRTRSLACKMKKHTSGSHYRFDRAGPGLPRASGFNGFFRALPGVHDVLSHRHRRDAKHRRQLDASQGASRPHDFAVRIDIARLATPRRPSHPALNVRDDAQRPSDRGGMGGNSRPMDAKAKRNLFSHRTGRPKSA